jgi:cytochrome P450
MSQPSVYQQIFDYAHRADPWPLYAELRKTPVTREEDGTYVVSTYREIVALLHDPRVASDRLDSEGIPPSFIRLAPPEHDRVRRLLTRHFGPPHSPRRIHDMTPELVEIVTGLIDDFGDRTEADLVDDFAYPFPVTVICRLLGVPLEDEPRFRGWADVIVEAVGARNEVRPELSRRRNQALIELGSYLGELVDAHVRQPGDDLLSALATDDGPEGRLSRNELMSNAALLLIAGHETTVNLITNGMLTLLRHPEVLARLREAPELAIYVVEELLRYEPTVHFLDSRRALDDIDIAGTTIGKGSPITLMLAAGNRDPAHVPDPDRFDPDRPRLEHLGFGGGIHYCFGAPLARLEAQIALAELAGRLENPRLVTDPPPYRPNPLLRGPRHLLVGFDRITPASVTGADLPTG